MHSRFLFLDWRCFGISSVTHQLNEEIRDKELRLIGNGGEQLGIMSAAEALKIAESRNLDLVKIAPMAKPPVCKVMDYGKFRFEKAKKEKEAKKNQKTIEIKEIRLSLNIDTHDFETKANHARRFLSDGNKVRVVMKFKGREMSHMNIGKEILEKCGGWPFHLLTEDIEFTVHNIIRGEKIGFCKNAVLYDEQPVLFSQSWRQRMRWAKGYLQVFGKYGTDLIKGIFRRDH